MQRINILPANQKARFLVLNLCLTMAAKDDGETSPIPSPRPVRKPMFEEGWEDKIETTMSADTAHKQAARDAARLQKQHKKVF
jgi:hypothetical protein